MNKIIFASIFEFYREKPSILFLTIMLIFLCYLISKYYPMFRGFMGEFWLKRELFLLPSKEYKIINNVMLKLGYNTTQIDSIVISKYGIFVIEMKNYHGKIYGNEFNKYWIQMLGRIKKKFYNPAFQNYGHIKALSNLLKIDESKFISVICFSNQARVKIKTTQNIEYIDTIVNFIRKHNIKIIDDDISLIYNLIRENNIKVKKLRKKHIKDINRIKNELKCPICNVNLKKINGKNGYFYGCSNFPKCNYTRKTKHIKE